MFEPQATQLAAHAGFCLKKQATVCVTSGDVATVVSINLRPLSFQSTPSISFWCNAPRHEIPDPTISRVGPWMVFHHENNKVLLPKTWIFLSPKDLDISEPLDMREQFLTICCECQKSCEVSQEFL